MGALYSHAERFTEAVAAFKETVDIRRQLAKQNPGAYQPELAGTLKMLSSVYYQAGRVAEAKAAFKEATDTLR